MTKKYKFTDRWNFNERPFGWLVYYMFANDMNILFSLVFYLFIAVSHLGHSFIFYFTCQSLFISHSRAPTKMNFPIKATEKYTGVQY